MPKTNILKKAGKPKSLKAAKRKKFKSKQISMKLSYDQYRALEKFCKKHETTPVRLIKNIIIKQIERYRRELPPPVVQNKLQLELF